MAVLPILTDPDPRLRQAAQPVVDFDAGLWRWLDDLRDTLRASGGIGLAAPQVGAAWQVLAVDLSAGSAPPEVYINPQLIERGEACLVEESCLSLPGVVGKVRRDLQIVVRALDRHGSPFEQRLQGMPAVCVQHEFDHLQGVLFVDRLPLLQRLKLRAGAWRRSRAALVEPRGAMAGARRQN
jgi:peptide deformylase